MSRVPKRLHGSGTAGDWADLDKFKLTAHYKPLRDSVDSFLGAFWTRNLYVGGSENVGLPGTATGDVTLWEYVPWMVDNTGSQITGFTDSPPTGSPATLVVQVRFLVRVSNAAINVTPKIWHSTTMGGSPTAATISGTAACAATNADYSGTDQIQTVALTLPTSLKYFKAGLTIAGTPDPSYQVWGRAYFDCYVSLP
jgi:hypothetical protein